MGFDISHWNNIKWDQVPTSTIKFVNIKATEGATYKDASFEESVKSAASIGLDIGAYHFTKFANNPYIEAANFLNTIFGLPVQRMYLDLEYRQTQLKGEYIYIWVSEFLKTISGVHPLKETGIYTSNRYLSEKSLQEYTDLNKYSLWAADWNQQPYVYPWKNWTTWQYTSSALVSWANGEIDMDYRVKKT
jgi:GH25 family lysozyme M1 (1,4-beta-N-acetylmuramidase)